MLRLVYVRGHKINIHDSYGNTYPHYACSRGHNDTVETLMLVGANETITYNKGKIVAEWYRRNELLELLGRDSLGQVIQEQLKKFTPIPFSRTKGIYFNFLGLI